MRKHFTVQIDDFKRRKRMIGTYRQYDNIENNTCSFAIAETHAALPFAVIKVQSGKMKLSAVANQGNAIE